MEEFPDIFESDVLDIELGETDFTGDLLSGNMEQDLESTISQSIRELLTIPIEPELRFKPEDSSSIMHLEVLNPKHVKANQFTSSTVSRRYRTRMNKEPERVILSIYLLSPSMTKLHYAGFFITGYEKDGVRNPSYVHRLAAQGKKRAMEDPFFKDMELVKAHVQVNQCELGYMVYDSQAKEIVLNKFVPQMSSAEWTYQPNPSITYQPDEESTGSFSVVYYITLEPGRTVQTTTRGVSTLNNPAFSMILDDISQFSTQISNTWLQHEGKLVRPSRPRSGAESDSGHISARKRIGPPIERPFKQKREESPERSTNRDRSSQDQRGRSPDLRASLDRKRSPHSPDRHQLN